MGIGVGFVEDHLLASAKLAGVPLWTADRMLKSAATELDLSYKYYRLHAAKYGTSYRISNPKVL